MMEIPDGLELTAFDDTFYADPYPVYERLRRLDPIHQDQVSFYPNSWTIADYQTVNQLLTDQRLSVDPSTIGLRRDPRADNPVTLREPDMMNLDEPQHQRLRSLVQKAFTPKSVEGFRTRIEAIVDECLANITEPTFDVVTELSKPIPTMAIAEYIGVDRRDHRQFKQWTDSLLLQGYPMPTDAQWDEIVAADQSLRTYMAAAIEQKRLDPQDDLITRLIAAQSLDDSLSDQEVVDMCYLLIGAGNFTTTDLISNCIALVLTQTREYQSTAALVEECLRFDSPVLAARRYATEDITLADSTIPKGSVVNLLLGAANHDPKQFDEAEAFRADRDPNRHVSFGRGIHHCLGAFLAKLEATIAVDKFLARYPNARIESEKRERRMDFRGYRSLIVNG